MQFNYPPKNSKENAPPPINTRRKKIFSGWREHEAGVTSVFLEPLVSLNLLQMGEQDKWVLRLVSEGRDTDIPCGMYL